MADGPVIGWALRSSHVKGEEAELRRHFWKGLYQEIVALDKIEQEFLAPKCLESPKSEKI